MPPSPAAPVSRAARGLLHAGIDLAVLLATSITFAGVLTAIITTDRPGWVWPSIPFSYERGDVLLHALLASLLVMPALLLAARSARWRGSARSQDLLFALATLLVIRLGPPDAQVFGTTWSGWEITVGLFLQQWPIVLPLTAAALLLRRLLRAAIAAG